MRPAPTTRFAGLAATPPGTRTVTIPDLEAIRSRTLQGYERTSEACTDVTALLDYIDAIGVAVGGIPDELERGEPCAECWDPWVRPLKDHTHDYTPLLAMRCPNHLTEIVIPNDLVGPRAYVCPYGEEYELSEDGESVRVRWNAQKS